MLFRATLLLSGLLALVPSAVRAAEGYDNCTGFIDALPAVITTSGTWCLRKNLSTGITSGEAIAVGANNVVIDCNDFKIGNLSAGQGTYATGIYTMFLNNITVRRCNLRGFWHAIDLDSSNGGGNIVVEHNSVQQATALGIRVGGFGAVVRDNVVSQIGYPDTHAVGIKTLGTVDILDNTINGVEGDYGAVGIQIETNYGGSVRGNRVRGLTSDAGAATYGMYIDRAGKMAIRDNDLHTNDAGTIGVFCFNNAQQRLRGNSIAGFSTAMQNCGDAGGNDVTD